MRRRRPGRSGFRIDHFTVLLYREVRQGTEIQRRRGPEIPFRSLGFPWLLKAP
jgi:hypothetical protein